MQRFLKIYVFEALLMQLENHKLVIHSSKKIKKKGQTNKSLSLIFIE